MLKYCRTAFDRLGSNRYVLPRDRVGTPTNIHRILEEVARDGETDIFIGIRKR